MFMRLFFLFTSIHLLKCARILCVFPFPSTTYPTVYQSVAKELALRGHQVSVVSANAPHMDLDNLTEIEISSLNDITQTKRRLKYEYFSSTMLFSGTYYKQYVEEILIHLETIFADPTNKFDLILAENLNPLIYSLGYRFETLMIGISSTILPVFNHDMMGNPSHPGLYFDLISNEGKLNFFDRVNNFVNSVIGRIFYHLYYLPFVIIENTKIYIEDDYSYIWNLDPIFNFYFQFSLSKNVRLILINTNPILHSVRANVPQFVEMNGLVHIHSRDKVPQDVLTYLDQSNQGVVYIDIGSELSAKIKNTIIETIIEFPYNVVWNSKFDDFSNKTKNILVKKLSSGLDILKHKNIKAFISQGNLPSVEDAIINCVPLVAIPSTVDQISNVRKIAQLGAGKVIGPSLISKNYFKNAIQEVIQNNKYKIKMKNLKYLLEDRIMGGLNKTIWWIEYVIRHKGAKILESPATEIYCYEYFFLDVLVLPLVICSLVIYIGQKIYS